MKRYIRSSASDDIFRKDEKFIHFYFPVFSHLDLRSLNPDVFSGIISDIRKWVGASEDETIEQCIYNEDDTRPAENTLREWLVDATDSVGRIEYSIFENDRHLADSISYLLYGEPVYVGM